MGKNNIDRLKSEIMNSNKIKYENLISLYRKDEKTTIIDLYNMTRKFIPQKLYQYNSFTNDIKTNESKLEVLGNSKIYMSDFKMMNDPFDTKGYFYNDEILKDYKFLNDPEKTLFKEMAREHYLTCFTDTGINNMPMWAHYSNNHNGYCSEYDLSDVCNKTLKSLVMPVEYIKKRVDVTNIFRTFLCYFERQYFDAKKRDQKEFDVHIKKFEELALVFSFYSNLKHISWKYENEFRCMIGKKSSEDNLLSAKPSAIYIGINCSEDNKKELIRISKKNNFEIHQMVEKKNMMDFNLQYDTLKL